MMLQMRWLSFCLVTLALLMASGCKPKDDDDSNITDGDATTSASSEVEANLAKLDEADRAVATKQKTCPVSGALLGSMDEPYKVTVEGRDVFLCCDGCEGELMKDPDKYLAKLPE